jgi:hypothetical protein
MIVNHTVTYLLEARTVEEATTAVTRRRFNSRHVITATDTHAATEELLEAVSCGRDETIQWGLPHQSRDIHGPSLWTTPAHRYDRLRKLQTRPEPLHGKHQSPDYSNYNTWWWPYRSKNITFLQCKIWGFHGGDYEEWRLLGYYTVWLL